jgi:hypothetical protein
VRRIGFFCLLLAFAPCGAAQSGNSADRAVPSPATEQAGVLDKVLGLVAAAPAAQPAHRETLKEFLMSAVGPVPLVGEAAGAGIGQWANWPQEWGQGWGAFGKRYGSNLAYNGIRQSITWGASAALGEDTRYFASSQSGFWPRTKHALAATFMARHADGSDTFSFSSTAGVLGAAAITSVWGPASWKGPGNIAESAGISFASTAGFNVVREFLPDIFHRPRK